LKKLENQIAVVDMQKAEVLLTTALNDEDKQGIQ